MKCEVIKSFRARSKGEIVQHNPGEKIQIRADKVPPLLNAGVIRLLEPSEPPTRLEDILNMPLSQFKKAGLLCRVRCGHLNGEDIFIASGEKEAAIGRAEGLTVYLADELIELVKGKPSPDVMRQFQEAKKIFQGILIETRGKEKK